MDVGHVSKTNINTKDVNFTSGSISDTKFLGDGNISIHSGFISEVVVENYKLVFMQTGSINGLMLNDCSSVNIITGNIENSCVSNTHTLDIMADRGIVSISNVTNVFISQFTTFCLHNKDGEITLRLIGKTNTSICELKGQYDINNINLKKCQIIYLG